MKAPVALLFSLALPAFAPTLAMADPATLEVVSASESWLFDEATCGDVRELFRVDPSVASDMPDGDVVSMLFVFAYVKGYAAASGEDYSVALSRLGAYCEAHPEVHWTAGP